MNDNESGNVEQSPQVKISLNSGHTSPLIEAAKKIDIDKLPDTVKACVSSFAIKNEESTSDISVDDILTMVSTENPNSDFKDFVTILISKINEEVLNITSISSLAAEAHSFIEPRVLANNETYGPSIAFYTNRLNSVLDNDYFKRVRALYSGIEILKQKIDTNGNGVSDEIKQKVHAISENAAAMKGNYRDIYNDLVEDHSLKSLNLGFQEIADNYSARIIEKYDILESDYQSIIGGSRERDG